jgi:hypothetical protein
MALFALRLEHWPGAIIGCSAEGQMDFLTEIDELALLLYVLLALSAVGITWAHFGR